MVILHFTLCGLSIKKGWLFGARNNPPLHTVNLLILRAHILSSEARSKMFTAMRGLCSDPLWMIENHESIKAAAKEAARKEEQRFEQYRNDHLEGLRQRLDRATNENMKLRTDNSALRRVIEIVDGPKPGGGDAP